MAPNITKDKLHQLLKQGLSEREIARLTGIPRSTLRQRIHALGPHAGHPGVRKPSSNRIPEGHPGVPLPQELLDAWEELKELLVWWRARKRALQAEQSDEETQRQTYHVEKRYIAAIQRAAAVEGVSRMAIVHRAFRQFFGEEGLPE